MYCPNFILLGLLGFVTTMRVTHATPAPVYAHSANRRWECEATMPAGSDCKDIARQLVEDFPGKDLQVILGGGMQVLVSNSSGSPADPLDTWSCRRQDGRNLVNSYIQDKQSRNLKYSYVRNNQELWNLNVNDTDYLFGIFANGHLRYEFERDDGPEGMPSIVDMTEAAIKVLQKNENGFFLMVEGGNIDMAHHRGRAKTAINESSAFDDAVQKALALTDEGDTLVIVTADHTHTLSINGYPERGADLFGEMLNATFNRIGYGGVDLGLVIRFTAKNLYGPNVYIHKIMPVFHRGRQRPRISISYDPDIGIAQASRWDNTNYTTLSYGTGGPGSMHYYAEISAEGEVVVKRRDPSLEDTDDFYYEQVAGVRTDENTHGGGDVTIYAQGPFSHLFHSVHEQHYVYHAISYAAKLGECGTPSPNRAAKQHHESIAFLLCLLLANGY